MGIFDRSNKPDTQVYQTGASTRMQNSRAYLLAIIAYMGIFLFGCSFCPLLCQSSRPRPAS